MKSKLGYDQLIGFILFIFSLALYFYIIPWEVEEASEAGLVAFSSSFMPKLISILLAFFSLLLLTSKKTDSQEYEGLPTLRSGITILLLITYLILTYLIGYLPATYIIFPIFLIFYGVRKLATIAIFTIIVPSVLYLFFAKIMLVMLPTGTIFN